MPYEANSQTIQLIGPNKRVDELQLLLSDYLTNVRCDKLTSISDEAINCENMINLLERIAMAQQILCKFSKKNDGFYLIYFQSISRNDEQRVEVYKRIENDILMNYTSTKIDFLNQSDALNGTKWAEFKSKNLTGNHNITFRLINSKELVIFGKKEVLFDLEERVQDFLDQNRQSTEILLNFKPDEVS